MILSKTYPYGGKKTKRFGGGMGVDKKTDVFGFKIGYVPRDVYPQPGEPIIVPTAYLTEFCDDLGIDLAYYVDKKNERESLRIRLAKKIAGVEIENYPQATLDIMAERE